MQSFLIGQKGLKERECYNVTFIEWRAYLQQHKRKIERGWEYVRYLAWITHSVSNVKSQFKKNSPEQFMPLSCDKERKSKLMVEPINQQLQEEQEKELFRIMSKIRKN